MQSVGLGVSGRNSSVGGEQTSVCAQPSTHEGISDPATLLASAPWLVSLVPLVPLVRRRVSAMQQPFVERAVAIVASLVSLTSLTSLASLVSLVSLVSLMPRRVSAMQQPEGNTAWMQRHVLRHVDSISVIAIQAMTI